jgi:hypothetical protein
MVLRPGKPFSANSSLIQDIPGQLTKAKLTAVVDAIVSILRPEKDGTDNLTPKFRQGDGRISGQKGRFRATP